jgi:hypothetical protein
MSDVRIVNVHKKPGRDYADHADAITDDPNGTHLLVPVGRVMFYTKPSHAELPEVDVCPTCGGSGDSPYASILYEGKMAPCFYCNGRGWVLAKGGGNE